MTSPRFADLFDPAAMVAAIDTGLVQVRVHPDGHTHLLEYSARTQWDYLWTPETRAARGLILSEHPSHPDALVLARPFAKFANAAEHRPDSAFGPLPEGRSFEVSEKVDGSMIIAYERGGVIELASRGAFVSPHAEAARRIWQARFADVIIPPGVTALFELVAPWNRIVVGYAQEDFIFLAALDNVTHADLDAPWWPGTRLRYYDAFADFAAVADFMIANDTAGAEGLVVRFTPELPGGPSLRVKMKYAEYVRLHRIATGISTTSIWAALRAGTDMTEILEIAPDELYDFVTTTADDLRAQHAGLIAAALAVAEPLRSLPRKDAASVVVAQREAVRGLVFAALDGHDLTDSAWRELRPAFERP